MDTSAKPPRLNRTSVGLKQEEGGAEEGGEESLNRTSVGLKPLPPPTGNPPPGWPQSNQRGIETQSPCRSYLTGFGASIEPAWD